MATIQRLRGLLLGLVPAVVVLAVSAVPAHAQAIFTGRVLGPSSAPLEGASVSIRELAVEVLTNNQGRFTITIPAGRVTGQQVTLTARLIGYKPVSRLIPALTNGERNVEFQLEQDITKMEEIVVTGVLEGTERAKVPFSVARLTTEELPVPAASAVSALQGKVAGVRVAQNSGQPGSSPEILIRGPTSINASGRGQGPLIIVDDAIMNVGSLGELGGMDIESIEVVKGAAGASLYGARAAAGVITIRTKRGLQQEGAQFNVRTEFGVSDLNSVNYGIPVNHPLQLDETGKRFCVLVAGQLPCSRTVDLMTEMYRINNVNADTTRTPQSIQYNTPSAADLRNIFQAQIYPNRYYNSLAQVTERSPTMLVGLDVTGRAGSVGYYVSGAYTDNPGAMKGLNGAQSLRGRVNVDYNARPDLKISVSTMYDEGNIDLRSGGSSNGGIFGQLLRGALPGFDFTARDTLGRYMVRSGGAGWRPTGNGAGTFLYDTEMLLSDRNTHRFLGSITGKYYPADWVTFEANFAYDNRNRRDNTIVKKGYRTFTVSTANNNGNQAFSNLDESSLNAALTATFRKQFGSDLNGKFSVRGLYDESQFVLNSTGGQIYRVADVYQTSNLSTNYTTGSSSELTRNVGLFAGASFDYKDRYVLEGSFRYDGSSRFGEGNRWSPFGRISGVWNVGREPFWGVDWMDQFRIRASYGTAGNTPAFSSQYETYNVSATGITLGQAGNSTLKPETTTEIEVGTDFTLFKKLGVDVTYATSKTRDQILPVNTPAALGFSTQWQNAGTLANTSWEIGVTLPIINNNTFFWQVRGAWDRNRTFVDELFVPEFIYTGGTAQGTNSFFLITDDKGKSNGFQKNRYGNIWGRKFYKKCSDLPSAVQGECGSGKAYQVNDQGYVVWVGQGNSLKDGITRNLWTTTLPASQSPWNYDLAWGHPIIDRPLRGEPGERIGISQIIGNVFPDYRLSFSSDFQWKRLTLYATVDATMGHEINNQGEGWGLLDLSSAQFDQQGKTVETAKPVGYSWRAGGPEATGSGGFYDVLGPNNYNTEDGSYAKFRELALTYRLGRVGGVGDWTIGAVGRNLFTITGYTGLDPETGVAGGSTGSSLINQVDAFGFPNLRTFTFSLSTRF
ncbi:MAG TPA: SusC/RagA family TonB-linked outer membrane protein [Gemmatimonadales bacterium]